MIVRLTGWVAGDLGASPPSMCWYRDRFVWVLRNTVSYTLSISFRWPGGFRDARMKSFSGVMGTIIDLSDAR
jgi:hypothetical protein